MSKSDAQKIEEHTGKNPEDMTDQELEQAMDELKIEKQYRDDSDQEITSDDGGDDQDYMDDLERLAKLRDEGVITKEDYETKKKQLLGI